MISYTLKQNGTAMSRKGHQEQVIVTQVRKEWMWSEHVALPTNTHVIFMAHVLVLFPQTLLINLNVLGD